MMLTNHRLALMPNGTLLPPSVDDMMRSIGPCPVEALVLGMCNDRLPVLINLDFEDFPFFVSAPEGWGKTHFLKTTLEFARRTNSIRERTISPVVLTNRPDEWMDLAGVVRVEDLTDGNLHAILRAAERFGESGGSRYALVLIDGWDSADIAMRDSFICRMAKRRKVCTIITSRTEARVQSVVSIWQGFRPGQFQTIENDRRLFFFVPSL